MLRCIQLAKNGLGTTYPNPLVGCVIVHEGKIIGEGWHYKAGQPHAEVNAITNVADKKNLKDSVLYVSLEPCNHYGSTPPCTDLIVASGIRQVVIGSSDPNPKVNGSGILRLREAGCEVTHRVLEDQCRELNKRFNTFHKEKRPYILLKWAQTKDGFISPLDQNRNDKKKPVWISNSFSRQRVHKLRSIEQAILIGTHTALKDNPSLTTRDWVGRSPIRIVIDKELKIPENYLVFDKSSQTIVITAKEILNQDNLIFEKVDFDHNLIQQICDILFTYNIQSVLIEGGGKTLQSFIDADLWDEAFVFRSQFKLGQGVNAPNFSATIIAEENIKEDILHYFKNPRL